MTSILVSLEGRLSKEENNVEVLNLLYRVFYTISTAMRFEPANAKFFHHEICMTSFCDTLRLLGCFSASMVNTIPDSNYNPTDLSLQDAFHEIFVGNIFNPV